mmetsp:Transcript_11398/g.25928  ORF Transcript_11398/g.25928 Transcript_11398/m.25928 type:complete len:304 (+) Transcript_11398:263-1174(+)
MREGGVPSGDGDIFAPRRKASRLHEGARFVGVVEGGLSPGDSGAGGCAGVNKCGGSTFTILDPWRFMPFFLSRTGRRRESIAEENEGLCFSSGFFTGGCVLPRFGNLDVNRALSAATSSCSAAVSLVFVPKAPSTLDVIAFELIFCLPSMSCLLSCSFRKSTRRWYVGPSTNHSSSVADRNRSCAPLPTLTVHLNPENSPSAVSEMPPKISPRPSTSYSVHPLSCSDLAVSARSRLLTASHRRRIALVALMLARRCAALAMAFVGAASSSSSSGRSTRHVPCKITNTPCGALPWYCITVCPGG